MAVDHTEHDDDADVARLLASLPRTLPVREDELERVVGRLHREGILGRKQRPLPWMARAIAAAVILAAGVFAGEWHGRRGSLEDMLQRRDLPIADRVLLLQRAGSAYVRAAQSYADATANVDSTAIEVASHVLLGAAHAIARSNLDAGLNARLTSALAPQPAPAPAGKPLIWF